MYDPNMFRRHTRIHTTWGEIKKELEEMGIPDDAKIFICGDGYFYIHVEDDKTEVSFDTDDLYEEYERELGIDIDTYGIDDGFPEPPSIGDAVTQDREFDEYLTKEEKE